MKLSNLALSLQALTGSDLETATCVRVLERNEWDEKEGKYKDKVVGYTYRCRANTTQEGQEDFFDVKVEGTDGTKAKSAKEIIEAIKSHGQAEVRFGEFSAKAYAFLGKDKTLVAGVTVSAIEVTVDSHVLY